MKVSGDWAILWLSVGWSVAAMSCGGAESGQHDDLSKLGVTRVDNDAANSDATSAEAHGVVSRLRARPGLPLPIGIAERFEPIEGGWRASFAPSEKKISARVRIPDQSLGAVRLDDAGGEAGVDISLDGALIVDGEVADGYVVYPNAHVSGATLLHRALPEGLEDYLSFETAPVAPAVTYRLSMRKGISGLRLVSGTLEMLDAGGAPRLRVSPPYIVGADGVRTDATLAVEGCRVDTKPAAPWGRHVSAPGAKSCRVRVSWDDDAVSYPAILDPRWTTTGSMVTARQDHTAILLPTTGKVLVAGGRTTGTSTTGLATAELFDQRTGTWAATGGMTGGRWSHSATLLNTSSNSTTSGKVLVAGGINGTASVATAQLYSASAGTWIAAGNLNAARHLHTATLLADGRVLVAGGMNGSATSQTAALYTPGSSGAGTWAATTGPLPPPGLRFHGASLITTSNQQLNGKVLLFGGNNGTSTVASVLLFDPVQSAFSTIASMPGLREQAAAVTLANGTILVAGGKNGSNPLATAVTFDPSTGAGSWSAVGSMASPRWGHSATVLPAGFAGAGQVVVAGGSNGTTLPSAELFSTTTSTWSTIASMLAPVQQHTAIVLGGKVLIAGGVNGSTTVAAAELFDGSFALACSSGTQCATGFCSNGVCCDTACNSGCGACNLAGKVGTCSAVTSGTVCRAKADTCDVAETCDGTSLACPANAFASSTTSCRPVAGGCDVAENCSGTSAACPADLKKAAGTVCRASAGVCDVQETCDGTSATCPTDGFVPSTTVCRGSAGVCDAVELCTGSSATCPVDAFLTSTTVCRPAAVACDQAESCTGTAATCPPDAQKPDGASCDDGDQCTSNSICSSGTCGGGTLDPVCAVTPRLDGVATIGSQKYAVFSYNNRGKDTNIPRGAQNQLSVNGIPLASPPTPPPSWFLAGDHPGVFTPTFTTTSLSWTVGTQTVTASSTTPTLPVVTQSQGQGVLIGSVFVTLVPDLSPFRAIPPEPAFPDEPAKGAEFHGVIPANLSVAPSGAAVYTVPIAIPPGIAGMAPVLSLVYNSQGGSGIAGQGFELTGLSVIHLCSRTKVDDGYSDVSFIDGPPGNAAVCLDGKRLFLRGESGSIKTFETETKDFSVITYDEAQQVFKVVTKTGETRSYGASAASRVSTMSSTVGQIPVMWLLDRVSDQWSNYYTVQYNDGQADFSARGVRPTRIDYTGHAGNPVTSTFRTIKFGYDSANYAHHVRLKNTTIPRDFRLKTIDTGVGVYSLIYEVEDPMLQSRLHSISYCANDAATCLESLTFDWDGGGYSWVPAPAYTLPAGIKPDFETSFFSHAQEHFSGTQFVDLDGDGRLDFVRMHGGQPNAAWQNTGSGWNPQSTWIMQGFDESSFNQLVNKDGNPGGGFFADFDGDGILDFISAPKAPCGDCPIIEIDGYCLGTRFCPNAPPIVVWLNRIREGQGWQQAPALAQTPASWGPIDLTNTDFIQDLNGDGLADIVRQDSSDTLKVLINKGPLVGWEEDPAYETTLDSQIKDFAFVDLNGDGYPDLIHNHAPSSSVVYNTGSPEVGFRFSSETVNPVDVVANVLVQPTVADLMADIDGDGRRDAIDWFVERTGQETNEQTIIGFGNGLGYSSGTADPLVASYQTSFSNLIAAIGVPATGDFRLATSAALVDLNADGLADMVVVPDLAASVRDNSHGVVHFNDGRGWLPKIGQSAEGDNALPFVPYLDGPGTFVDLDGDGVLDLAVAQNSGSSVLGASYLNKFRPPVIKQFGNGLAAKSQVSYSVITTADAKARGIYRDDTDILPGTRNYMIPLRVVESMQVDNGAGGLNETQYRYASMRASASGHGPQGFASVEVTDPSKIVMLTTFAQAFPYTGLPTSVSKGQPGFEQDPDSDLLTKTVTTYCDDPTGVHCTPMEGGTYAPATSFFVYPMTVTDTTMLRTSLQSGNAEFALAGETTTTTTTQYDDLGNPTQVTVDMSNTTGEHYQRVTANDYGASDSTERQMGKPTQIQVDTQRLSPAPTEHDGAPTSHLTTFEYAEFSGGAFALSKTNVEPHSPQPGTEVHTAYDYDEFGNVTTTTVCASDFDDCVPGAAGPPELPFRTTIVSYDPADYTPSGDGSVTALGYDKGRHPVRTINAAGQPSYSSYDQLIGKIAEVTATDGVHTCMFYDQLGALQATKDRCGSAGEVTTVVNRYLYNSPDIAFAQTVTVTRPPTGSPTWAYSDVLGRTVGTRTRGFNGDFTNATTRYDALGRVHIEMKPYLTSQGSGDFSVTGYDDIGRVSVVDEPVGIIDGSVPSGPITGARTRLTTTYLGTTVQTDQTALVPRRRLEAKNLIGKVSSVTDADGNVMQYWYDAEGNLVATTDPLNNETHMTYDLRGRKITSHDPDLGDSIYTYDGFGDLLTQRDAKLQLTTMTYDVLGRMTGKTDATGASEWVYDIGPGATSHAGVGKLAYTIGPVDARLNGSCLRPFTTENQGKRPVRSYQYTQFGEVSDTFECTDGEIFQTTVEYDLFGRQLRVHYPAIGGEQLTLESHFTQAGYLQYVKDVADGGVYWQAQEVNALGQVTREQTRNGVGTTSGRDPDTGWLLSSTSSAHAENDTIIQNWSYRYDEVGNLTGRTRADHVNGQDSTETFHYDSQDRLLDSSFQSLTVNSSEGYSYDVLGNFMFKAGRQYHYGTCGAGPHAVCSVADGSARVYDPNGNMTSGDDRTVTYNAEDKPMTIGRSGTTVDFVYGADGNRVVQQVASTNSTARTVYVGLGATGTSLYERTTRGTNIEHTQFLYAGGGPAFAIRTVTEEVPGVFILGPDGIGEMKYYHRDHLGSITAMSDRLGNVIDSSLGGRDPGVFGYDPWGERRTPEGAPLADGSVDDPVGRRGFTGQESIEAVGLTNMNGRVYDPVLGRFLSADPTVQFVGNLQSYNRYSYALNNPLRYTDPTGYSAFHVGWAGDIILGVIEVGLCAVGGPACAIGAVAIAGVNYGSAVAGGAPWDQALIFGVVSASFNFGFGLVGSGVAGELAGEFGGDLTAQLVGGAVSGAANAAFSTVMSSGLNALGENLLIGAAEGAAGAAFAYALRFPPPLSQASQSSGGQDRSPQWLSSRSAVVSDKSGVTDSAGNTIGYVGVVTYRDETGGLGIRLVYRSTVQSDDDLNWVQTVETNYDRRTGRPSHFIDNGGGEGTNYYESPALAARLRASSQYDAQFWDEPGRTNLAGEPRPNVQWSAEVSLVSMRNSAILTTFTYGFSSDFRGNVSLLPLSVSEPSPFQIRAIP